MILLPQHPGFFFFQNMYSYSFFLLWLFSKWWLYSHGIYFFPQNNNLNLNLCFFFFSSPKCGPNTLLYCTNEQILQVFVFSCGFIWQWVNVKVSVLLRVMGGKDMFTTCSCFATKKKWRRTRLLISAGALQILTSHSPSLFPLRSTSGRVSVCPKRTRHLVLFIPSLPVVDFSFQK